MQSEDKTKSPQVIPPQTAKADVAAKPDVSKMRTGMIALCSGGLQFGVVDRVEGGTTVRLSKDEQGIHHYVPMGWIERIDEKVHANRPLDQIRREWTVSAPSANAAP